MSQITDNSVVTLHFEIRFPNGDVVDSNFEGNSATFAMGDGSLLPGFEAVLLGLKVGDRQTFTLLPEQAFGETNEDNRLYFKKSRFKEDELVEGLIISFDDAAKTQRPGVISVIEQDRVLVDFNHPLAGRTLLFEVDIIGIAAVDDAQVDDTSTDKMRDPQ